MFVKFMLHFWIFLAMEKGIGYIEDNIMHDRRK